MKQKKMPMRRCIGCYESKPKKELLRIVKSAEDGSICIDTTGRKNGRGAYICPSETCFAQVIKGHKLNKEFECAVSDEVYQSLMDSFQSNATKSGGGAIG